MHNAARTPLREAHLTTPPEITAEIVIELIATVCADLQRLADGTQSEDERARALALYDEVRDRRFEFDPHDHQAVEAMAAQVSAIAEVTRAGRIP